jgi:hypothetical protein
MKNMFPKQIFTSLILFVVAATACAFADPVEAHFAALGGASQNGEYTYPYFVTLDNGPRIPMICDDFYHQSGVGDTWQANITALSGGDLQNTRFGDLTLYEQGAYLLLQINDANQAEWGNINFAVWKIFSPSVNLGDVPPGTLGPQYWYDLAQTANLDGVDFSSVMILTPLNAHAESGVQEFLYATPEPGTLLLIGSGLTGLFVSRKRFCSQR